jgi:hypothetical protein
VSFATLLEAVIIKLDSFDDLSYLLLQIAASKRGHLCTRVAIPSEVLQQLISPVAFSFIV